MAFNSFRSFGAQLHPQYGLPYPEMPPEEEASLLNSVLDTGATFLQGVGSVLDTPGSFIRSLMVGKNPFPGIIDTQQRVSGADVLKDWGILPKQESWLDYAAGIPLEIVADPFFFASLPFGAATKAGQIAKGSGVLDDLVKYSAKTGKQIDFAGKEIGKRAFQRATTLEDLIREGGESADRAIRQSAEIGGYNLDDLLTEPLRKTMEVGIPFGPKTQFDLPFGIGEKIDTGLDYLGGKLRGSQLGIQAARVFNRHVRDAGNIDNPSALATQRLAEKASRASEKGEAYAAIRGALAEQHIREMGFTDQEVIRQAVELTHPDAITKFETAADAVAENFPTATPEQATVLEDYINGIHADYLGLNAQARARGAEAPEWTSEKAAYSHREDTRPSRQKGIKQETFQTKQVFGGRDPRSALVQGGTATENRALTDQAWNGLLKENVNGSLFSPATEDQIEALEEFGSGALVGGELENLVADQAEKMLQSGAHSKAFGYGLDLADLRTQFPGKMQANTLAPDAMQYGLRQFFGYDDKKIADIALTAGRLKNAEKLGLTPDDIKVLSAQMKAHTDNMAGVKYMAERNLRTDAGELAAGMKPYGNSAMKDSATNISRRVSQGQFQDAMTDLIAENIIPPEAGSVPLRDAGRAGEMGMSPSARVNFLTRVAKKRLDAGAITQAQYDGIVGIKARYAANAPEVAEQLAKMKGAKSKLGAQPRFNDGLARLSEAMQNIKSGAPDPAKVGTLIEESLIQLQGVSRTTSGHFKSLREAKDLLAKGEIEPALKKLQKAITGISKDKVFKVSKDGLDEIAKNKIIPEMESLLGVQNWHIPGGLHKDINGLYTTVMEPRATKGFFKWYDKFLGTFKGLNTFPFLAYPMRNLTGLGWQGLASGTYDPATKGLIASYAKPWQDMKVIMSGGEIKGIAKRLFPSEQGLTDAKATDKVRAILAGFNTAADEPLHQASADVLNLTSMTGRHDLLGRLPGKIPKDMGPLGIKAFGRGWWDTLSGKASNPLNVPGGIYEGNTFGAVRGGMEMSNHMESMGRGATMLAKLYQGYAPHVAAAVANAAHVPYNELGNLERKIAKRVIPFYTWARHIVPWTLRDLVQHPGGLNAQAIRTANEFQQADDSGFIPPEVQMSLGIKLPGEDKGLATYLTGVDLPFETLNDYLKFGRGGLDSLTQTGRAAIGQSAPWVRGPLEEVFGRSLYKDRALEDTESQLGRFLANIQGEKRPVIGPSPVERTLMNTVGAPASRLVSTINQLTNTNRGFGEAALRNALNLTTGVKLRQVDLEKSKELATLDTLKDALRGQPGFSVREYLTVPKEAKPNLSYEQTRLYQLYQNTAQKLRDRSKTP